MEDYGEAACCLLSIVGAWERAGSHHEPPGEFVRFAPHLNHARDYLDRDALLGDLAGVEARLLRVGRGECVINHVAGDEGH